MFMLAVATVCLASACSDDDNYNTNSKGTTVEFASTEMTVNENADIFNIPVTVSGERNGKVSFRIEVSEVGQNPAKEDVNYIVTTKKISLDADTMKTNTANVEVKAVDDRNMNADRTFAVTIVSADGATVGNNKTITVTLKDNDTSFFNIFSGEWKLVGTYKYTNSEDNKEYTKSFSQNITISSPSDADNFEHRLFAYAPNWVIPNLPVSGNFNIQFIYTYNSSRKTGTLAFESGIEAMGYDSGLSHFSWTFAKYVDGAQARGNYSATWAPTEDQSVPDEITFDENSSLAILETGMGAGMVYGCEITDLKLKRR